MRVKYRVKYMASTCTCQGQGCCGGLWMWARGQLGMRIAGCAFRVCGGAM